MQQDLNDLYFYAQVVEHGGFASASRKLGIPKSKLSRRIALLEERLGVRLIQRSTRRFSVTELGQAYYARCKAMLVEADAAQDVINATHSEPCGIVRLSCPIALLHAHVAGMLTAFAVQYPQVTIQLVAVNRPVDVIAEGFDLALRVRPLPLQDSDLSMRLLAHAEQYLVASPTLVQRYGTPQTPQALLQWPSLGHGLPQQEQVWSLQNNFGETINLDHTPRFLSSDMVTLQHAAIAGVGVTQLPAMFVQEQLASGALIHLLPDWVLPTQAIHAVFPSRRGLLASVRCLIDFLANEFELVKIYS
jgi:DNA-binding transcriptional LysR family regulator